MSLLDSLALALAHLGALQLGCAFVAAMAYPLALDATLPPRTRGALFTMAAAAATTFAAAGGDWPSGVALMLLGVAGLALFTAIAWATSRALGLDRREPAVVVVAATRIDEAGEPPRRPAATLPRPVRST